MSSVDFASFGSSFPPTPVARLFRGVLGGPSERLREVERRVAQVLEGDLPVLLSGENGSGKEQVARVLHAGSPRGVEPFLSFDCTAFDANEQELLLFGREGEGPQGLRGVLERASGGVLYLAHVDRLSGPAQAGLVALLSGQGLLRPDGSRDAGTNVRVLAGTTRELRELVAEKRFSAELFERLSVYPIAVPALRERKEDLPWLVGHFLRELGARMGGGAGAVSPDALAVLMEFDWPGNLRELEGVIQRSMLSARSATIGVQDLPRELLDAEGQKKDEAWLALAFPENEVVPLRELERLAIEHALRVTGGSVALAAQRLGIGRATLYRRLASRDLGEKVA